MVVAVLSGTSAVAADSDAMVRSGRHAVHRRHTGTHTDARRGRRWTVWAAALVVIASTVFLGTQFAQTAVAPGYATWQDKTSTLLRAVGMGPVLDRAETWLYTRSAPSDTPPDPASVTMTGAAPNSPGAGPRYPGLPTLAHTADDAGWHAVVRVPGNPPVVYTAVIQPDPLHRSVVVGIGLVRSSAVQAHLEPGTVQPVRSGSAGQIPSGQLPDVAAAFNSGFKMSANSGGFYLDGTTVRTLVDGKASAVIDDTGRLSIGQWGRDIQMSSHVRAVRQNLALIVEGGQPVPGLDRNVDLRWGTLHNQLQYTWRSAMGITRSGDIIYVAGDKLNLATLGVALAQAGAITGMELDIHSGMEFFSSWRTDGAGGSAPQRLMSAMVGPADRYVRPDQRDFFYFTATPTTPAR
ncbi:MAG: hypothetical protein JWR34_7586 [Mycobacterium sp.]|jgi:hypothetical protein|nr:hypothetical protein [Mycobacterium sp.]